MIKNTNNDKINTALIIVGLFLEQHRFNPKDCDKIFLNSSFRGHFVDFQMVISIDYYWPI